MRMLFDYFGTDKLLICMEPENLDLLNDFTTDRSTTRILEIECQFTDAYLTGHAMRVGLAGDHTSLETLQRLLPTIRNDMAFESDQLHDAQFENFSRMREHADADQNAEALTQFLSIPKDKAAEILQAHHLFSD